VKAARIAVMHTWLSTQDEGWWRLAFESVAGAVHVHQHSERGEGYGSQKQVRVLIFAPVGRGAAAIINGLPMYGNPLPWKTTTLTTKSRQDRRDGRHAPGLGWNGLMNLQKFVQNGGVLITAMDTPISRLLITHAGRLGRSGATSAGRRRHPAHQGVDSASPIAYGYGDSLAMYCSNGPIFNLSNTLFGGGGRRSGGGQQRTTGRGTPDDPDTVQGRPPVRAPEMPKAEVWQALPFDRRAAPQQRGIIPPQCGPGSCCATPTAVSCLSQACSMAATRLPNIQQ